ncbi:hypothetical protein [Mastigocladopsis repens]|nr:hypothetical protein [Mastigocladopsis repens]
MREAQRQGRLGKASAPFAAIAEAHPVANTKSLQTQTLQPATNAATA